MMSGLLPSLAAGILPMALYAWLLYFLDRYEKEPLRVLLGMFSWGAIIAAGGAFLINTLSGAGIYLLTRSQLATQFTLSTLVAPVVEESLKGAAVLLVFLAFRDDFDSVLDGIVYAGIAALGFAATENIWYIFNFGFLPGGWSGLLEMTLIRSILVGWQHPFYSAFIGIGVGLSRTARKAGLQWMFPILGWMAAVFFHLSHNLLAGLVRQKSHLSALTLWDWSGYLGLLVLVLLLIRREQTWMKEMLHAEQEQGLISDSQYQTASSAWKQSLALLRSLAKGSYLETRQFYQACGDLMHKKRQLQRQGDHQGTMLEVQRLQSELCLLAEPLKSAGP